MGKGFGLNTEELYLRLTSDSDLLTHVHTDTQSKKQARVEMECAQP